MFSIRLFPWDWSLSSTNFGESSSGSKRPFSIDLMFFSNLVFTCPNYSSSWLCINYRLLANSPISVAILSWRSIVACRFELIRALMVFLYAASSLFTIYRMISESDSSSSFISLLEVRGVSCTETFLVCTTAFGVDFDLTDDCFKFTMVNNNGILFNNIIVKCILK